MSIDEKAAGTLATLDCSDKLLQHALKRTPLQILHKVLNRGTTLKETNQINQQVLTAEAEADIAETCEIFGQNA